MTADPHSPSHALFLPPRGALITPYWSPTISAIRPFFGSGAVPPTPPSSPVFDRPSSTFFKPFDSCGLTPRSPHTSFSIPSPLPRFRCPPLRKDLSAAIPAFFSRSSNYSPWHIRIRAASSSTTCDPRHWAVSFHRTDVFITDYSISQQNQAKPTQKGTFPQ